MDDLLLHLGYIFLLVALAVKEIFHLRLLLTIAQFLILSFALTTGNTTVAFWNFLFLSINLIQLLRILNDRRKVQIPEDIRDIYENVFSVMLPLEFFHFWGMGKFRKEIRRQMIWEGDQQQELLFVIAGEFHVLKSGQLVASLKRGSFVAEMSFLTGNPATADVFATDGSLCKSWSQEELRKLKDVEPQLFIKLQSVLGKDLIEKLRQS